MHSRSIHYSLLSAMACAHVLGGVPATSAESAFVFGSVTAVDGSVVGIDWPASADFPEPEDGVLRLRPSTEARVVARTSFLPLVPLSQFALDVTTRRGPGTKVGLAIHFRGTDGTTTRRSLQLQLSYAPRAGHLALSPRFQRYVQNVCVPAGTGESWFEITVEGGEEADLSYLELSRLTFRHVGPVPFGAARGPNLLPAGAMEIPGRDGVPLGWDTWGYAHPDMELCTEALRQGRSCLKIAAGKRFYLASAHPPEVRQGRAYEMSFWARGKGHLSVLAHLLSETRFYPLPVRVGDAQARNIALDSSTWARFDQIWFAESPWVQTGQVVFVIAPSETMFLDDVQFRLIEVGGP